MASYPKRNLKPRKMKSYPAFNMKSKTTAALLAFFLGGLGIHRFYLGETMTGLIYLFFCWTFIPLILSLFDFLFFLLMSNEKFNLRYNYNRGF